VHALERAPEGLLLALLVLDALGEHALDLLHAREVAQGLVQEHVHLETLAAEDLAPVQQLQGLAQGLEGTEIVVALDVGLGPGDEFLDRLGTGGHTISRNTRMLRSVAARRIFIQS